MSTLHVDNTPAGQVINILSDWDIHKTANNDETISIMNDRTTAIGTDDTTTIGGKLTETIKGDTKITIQSGEYYLGVEANKSTHHVNGDVTEWYDATQKTNVFNNIEISSGNAQIVLTAKTSITLNCGASHLCLNSDGTILLNCAKIMLNGTANITLNAPNIAALATTEAKLGVGPQNIVCDANQTGLSGAAINSSAVGIHTIAGAVVKIN
jgi:type VI secretion system secreted protein VgrG